MHKSKLLLALSHPHSEQAFLFCLSPLQLMPKDATRARKYSIPESSLQQEKNKTFFASGRKIFWLPSLNEASRLTHCSLFAE